MSLKIGGSAPLAGISHYKNVQKAAPKQAVAGVDTDKVDISASARSFDLAFQAVRNTPDVRMDKVNALQEAVKTGTYKVDSRAIADKIITEAK